jgi:hypothetical protein
VIIALQAPFARVSGTAGAPSTQNATGGIVMGPDASGRTIGRAYVSPSQPNTAAQLAAQARISTTVEAYQSLTIEQVEAWTALALQISAPGRLGLSKTMSWTQLFNQVNNYRLQDGQTIIFDPPAITAAPVVTAINSVASDDGDPDQVLTISISSATSSTTGFLAFRFTRPMASPIRLARDTDLRYVTSTTASIIARLTGTTTNYSLTATTLNVLSNTHIGVEVTVLNAGYVPTSRVFVKNTIVIEP